jgi:hypothetical protein
VEIETLPALKGKIKDKDKECSRIFEEAEEINDKKRKEIE